jgi:tetratricopeptide (TPR) repeat protein
MTAQLYTNLALLYLDLQQPEAAERALYQATALEPDNRQAQFQLGLLLADQGENDEALEAWRAADAAQYFLRRGRTLAGDDQLEAAVRQYEIALNIQPDLYEGYELLGRTLRRLGLREEALNALTSAVALTPPTSAHRYLMQAEIHLAREAWRAAVDAYQQAAALDPWDATSLYRSGNLRLEKLQDVSGAITDYERAVSRDPQHTAARLALGEIYHARRACTDVGYWVAPLLTGNTDPQISARAHALVGTCLLSRTDSSGLWYLEQAVALQPQAVGYRLALADGHRQFGYDQKALTLYQEVLDLAPDNAAAQQALQELGGYAP